MFTTQSSQPLSKLFIIDVIICPIYIGVNKLRLLKVWAKVKFMINDGISMVPLILI